jgi:hypothetical protein
MRIETVIDEMLDSRDEAERLTGSRPGDDQHRAEWRLDGALLLGQGN